MTVSNKRLGLISAGLVCFTSVAAVAQEQSFPPPQPVPSTKAIDLGSRDRVFNCDAA